MELKQIAQGAPYHLTTSMKECSLHRFWVVLLDCGLEIYQSRHDSGMDNPWLRLKQFCQDNDVKPVNMAWATHNLDPSEQINLDSDADGFFYSKRVRRLFAPTNPAYGGYQDNAEGVGQLRGDILTVYWIKDDGTKEAEHRDLSQTLKHQNPISLIRK